MAPLNTGQGQSGSFWQNVFSWKVLFYLSWIIMSWTDFEEIFNKISKEKAFAYVLIQLNFENVYRYFVSTLCIPNLKICYEAKPLSSVQHRGQWEYTTELSSPYQIPVFFQMLSIDFKLIFILFAIHVKTRKTLWDPFKVRISYFWHGLRVETKQKIITLCR